MNVMLTLPRVLMVEDERVILEMFARSLAGRCHVVRADNGDVAIRRLLSEEDFDVAFVDLMLGEGPSGFDVLRECVENAPARLHRMVLVTGAKDIPGVEDEIARIRQDTGAALELVSKPFDVEHLVRIIRRFAITSIPRGPRARVPAIRKTTASAATLPDYSEEEVSTVTQLSQSKDPLMAPVATRLREHGETLKEHGEKITEIEAHFKVDPKGKDHGTVIQHGIALDRISTTLKVLMALVVLVGAAVGAIQFIAKSSQPNARDIARELKTMQDAK